MKGLFVVAVERCATKLACNEERGHEVGTRMSGRGCPCSPLAG